MAIWKSAMENLVLKMVGPKFWNGKRVFLTGHTGFKGSWLSLWLQYLGAEVTGFALPPPTKPNLFEAAFVEKGMRSIVGDIRDLDFLKKAIKEAKPEILIHMAAQPLVRFSYINPVETYATNVMGTVHLLEAARETPSIKTILNVTSDKCYDNKEVDRGYREDEPMGGFDPYSNSKGCAELVSSAYRNSFFNTTKFKEHGVALATARAGNVIGGGDWAEDRLIPDFIRAIQKKEKVIIRNPSAIRPWQHVLEPLNGYLMLCQKLYEEGPKFSESFNFGPNEEDAKNVEWIALHLVKAWGENAAYKIISNPSSLHEAHFLKLDCTKSKSQLDWKPKWNINQALDKICAWHKAYLMGEDMNKYSLNDIKIYSKYN
jgi:CDP-glucose 4,6-dehydratase